MAATRGKGGQGGGGGKEPPRKRAAPKKKRPPKENAAQEKTPKHGNPDADPVRIHREYVEQRTGGGAPPTGEAYRRALEQWHQLPGAVRRPATEVGPTEEVPPPGDDDQDQARDPGSTEEGRP